MRPVTVTSSTLSVPALTALKQQGKGNTLCSACCHHTKPKVIDANATEEHQTLPLSRIIVDPLPNCGQDGPSCAHGHKLDSSERDAKKTSTYVEISMHR